MKEIYYTYNNEAIASCIFLSVLNKVEKLDIAHSCLILPFLLDDSIINYLHQNQNSELNLEQIVYDKSRLFASFNKRFTALLPVSINSLVLLSKTNQIEIGKEISINSTFNIEENMGDRFNKIESIVPFFLSLIEKYSTTQLYQILKIQL
ncbi:MAG: hypothetical protein HN704_13845 [Bacteroidetes bacterium]|jgi:hypothetical protein|nr:hypothetical protein [Bacteroidota bacterium]MBT7143440.1 hypothetical protein [Bacteroidota bacterium]MBT7492679.1 hypothetical protein [Bacteroidota bacterium]